MKDKEPLFIALNSNDPKYQSTIKKARKTLDTFESLYEEYSSNISVYFSFKTSVIDGDQTAYLWYTLESIKDGVFYGEHYDIPVELSKHTKVKRTKKEIFDWMINDSGILYGGFSIRYQRSKVAKSRKAEFDEHIGVDEYRDI